MKKTFLTIIIIILLKNIATSQMLEHIIVDNKIVITLNITGEVNTYKDFYYSVVNNNYKKIPKNQFKISDDNITIIWHGHALSNTDLINLKIKLTGNGKFVRTLVDSRDNKIYKAVKIGNQIWMSENLAYKATKGCWAYNNKQTNVTKYGYLYNWETANNVCPSGWHLPSKYDYNTLLVSIANKPIPRYYALRPNGKSGFQALFGGYRLGVNDYNDIGRNNKFWSSSDKDGTTAWNMKMDSNIGRWNRMRNNKGAYISSSNKNYGYSVRCIQDK